MKAIIFSLIFVFIASQGYAQAIQWMSLEEVAAAQELDPRPVFVDVYATWCGPCKSMDRNTFGNLRVQQYVAEHFYAVKLNGEGSKTDVYQGQSYTESKLARHFRIRAYPTILLLDSDMELQQNEVGSQRPAQFINLLQEFEASL